MKAPAGLTKVKKEQAALYPNPAEDKLFIKGASSMTYQVDIYNLNGSKMLSASVKGNDPINSVSPPVNLYMVK